LSLVPLGVVNTLKEDLTGNSRQTRAMSWMSFLKSVCTIFGELYLLYFTYTAMNCLQVE